MKQKLFFLLSSMNIGGVEKSFLSLLSIISRDKYEIHLGLLQTKGGFMEYVPEDVHIYHIDCYTKKWRIINDLLKHRKYGEAFVHLLLYIHFKLTSNRYLFYKYLLRDEPMFAESFDVAVAYAGPSQAIDYYVCKRIKADVKVGWVHFDVTQFGIDKGMTKKLYQDYKKVFIVSGTAKERFDSLFPTLRHKTEVFYNVVSQEQIRQLADKGETFTDDYAGKRILTVGRLSKEKGQDVAVRALKLLLDKGLDVRWYFVGDGLLRKECEMMAKELDIAGRVVFLGTQVNPYAYMRDCDIYMQPSRHEGFCITLAEVLCFDNPIVATNFTGAEEQLRERENGLVCGMSAEEMADGICALLGN